MRTAILSIIAVCFSQTAAAQMGPTPGAPNVCTLFKPAEVSAYLGEPVESGVPDTLKFGCVWYAKDDDADSFAMLVIWPKKEADTPHLEKSVELHPELGPGGYAIKDFNIIGSWTGGVVIGDYFFRASLVGPSATKAQLLAWLRAVVAKRGVKVSGSR